jgi:hypothetical protein
VTISRGLTLVALGLAATVMVGCRIPENALDGPLAVPLRITTTAETIEVDAPAWFAAETALYVCPAQPPSLPEPGPARVGWTPGAACHDFGRVQAADGLRAVLALDDLSDAEREAFAAVADWYLLVVKQEGDRASAAITSSFASPIQPSN